MPTADPAARPRGAGALLQYLALALTWGTSFLFIKIGLEELSPGQVVLARMVLGSLALGALMLATRQRLPREPAVYAHLVVVGLLICVVPFLLFSWAELQIPSGLASILNATTPLMTMVVALAALRQEALGWGRAAGLIVGFAGVVIVVAPWSTGASLAEGELLAKLACLAATACYGVAFVWLRRFIAPRGLPSVPVAFLQVGQGTLLLLVAAPWFAATPVELTPRVLGAILPLGILGTGLAYVWNTNVVAAWGAVRASTVTYLAPLVGVLAGALVLGEPVTAAVVVGGLTIILGITLGHNTLQPLLRRLSRLGPAAGGTPQAQLPPSDQPRPTAVPPSPPPPRSSLPMLRP